SVALSGRGLRLKKRKTDPQPPAPEPPKAPPPSVPLDRFLARVLVDHYCEQIADPEFNPTRGLRLKARNPAQPVPVQRAGLRGDVLLPPTVRQRIRALGAEGLVIVPDGPLHKLPFEALLFASAPKPVYAVDELPPIVYCPSSAVLPVLAGRPRPSGELSLLTVSNPAYPEGTGRKPARGGGDAPSQLLGFQGQLERLKFTAEESKRVASFFGGARVKALTGPEATEANLAASVAGKRVLHIAAHGFADEQFGNLFGVLALTPP